MMVILNISGGGVRVVISAGPSPESSRTCTSVSAGTFGPPAARSILSSIKVQDAEARNAPLMIRTASRRCGKIEALIGIPHKVNAHSGGNRKFQFFGDFRCLAEKGASGPGHVCSPISRWAILERIRPYCKSIVPFGHIASHRFPVQKAGEMPEWGFSESTFARYFLVALLSLKVHYFPTSRSQMTHWENPG